MHVSRSVVPCVLLFTVACGGRGSGNARLSELASPGGSEQLAKTVRAAAGQALAPLGESEQLTRADVDLYVKVMRVAAERVRKLPATDRAALKALRDMTTNPSAGGAMPSMDQIAALQRAGELMGLDSTVAREMGVNERYGSIKARVPKYGMPEIEASGDEPVTAEERARIARFRRRWQQDQATLAPYRAEIESLQKQVDLITHPESIPK